MLKNKFMSYTILLLIYVVSFGIGLLVYNTLGDMNLLLRFLIMDIVTTLVIFIFSWIFNNSSIYDPYWSVLPQVMVIVLSLSGKTFHWTSYIMIILIEVWGLRLTLNCLIRFGNLKKQDWRYNNFQEKYPRLWPLISLTGIHLFPTLIVYLLMLPTIAYFDAVNNLTATNNFNMSSILAVIIAVAGIIFELVSDIQSSHYRKKYPGKILNKGLWKVSRHPNYFGEIIFWFGIFLLMLSIKSNYWVLVLGPLANLLMFSFISIPMMEKRLINKYPEYIDYAKNTNVLLPIKKQNN